MKIRVFQIDHKKDSDNLAFRSYEKAIKSGKINSSIYRQVYGGTVSCRNLEEVFTLCNTQKPSGYCGELMSVSNVVEVCDGYKKGFYYCDKIGFKAINFDISQTDHADMLRVLIIENGKEPYEAEIRNCLKAKQSVVGGLIEPVYFDNSGKFFAFCNEEFLLNGS